MFRVSQVTAWMGSWSTCLVASSTFSLQTEATSLWRISAMLKVYFISTTTVLTSRQNQTIDSSATCFVLFSLQVPTCWKWLWRRMDIISTHTSTKLLFIHLRPRAKKLMTKRKIVKVKVGTWELDFFFHPLLQKVCADNTHGQTKMTCECLCVCIHPSVRAFGGETGEAGLALSSAEQRSSPLIQFLRPNRRIWRCFT